MFYQDTLPGYIYYQSSSSRAQYQTSVKCTVIILTLKQLLFIQRYNELECKSQVCHRCTLICFNLEDMQLLLRVGLLFHYNYTMRYYGQLHVVESHDTQTPSVPVNSQKLDLPIWPQVVVNRFVLPASQGTIDSLSSIMCS